MNGVTTFENRRQFVGHLYHIQSYISKIPNIMCYVECTSRSAALYFKKCHMHQHSAQQSFDVYMWSNGIRFEKSQILGNLSKTCQALAHTLTFLCELLLISNSIGNHVCSQDGRRGEDLPHLLR